ncbi:MAG: GGDEF domain-containing protein [Micavibrio sp.]
MMPDFIQKVYDSLRQQKAQRKGAKRSVKPAQALAETTPARSLSLAYILALGVIAVLTVGSHILTAHITTKQKEGAEIAYKIGQQRALIQDVVKYAEKYYLLADNLDLDLLKQSIEQMESGQRFLTNTINQRDILDHRFSEALHKVYFMPPYVLNEKMGLFLTWGREYASLPLNDPSRRQIALREMTAQLPASLASGLDTALENYQTEAQIKTDRYYALQFYSAIFVLLVLVIEAWFIFRPLVTRVDEYHQMLLRYALEDYLTGLNNRRAFMKRATTELRRAEREGETVVVVLSDLDKFKSVNDTYGHKVGDLVLQHYAEHLQQLLRSGDIIGRIGGEEFAILLPKTGAEMGFQTIDRLREKIAQTPCPYVDEQGQKQMLSYTASFGLVVVEEDFSSIDDLLAVADTGLYQAKERGRNCVVPVTLERPQKKAARS